jgi:hypothetical protein
VWVEVVNQAEGGRSEFRVVWPFHMACRPLRTWILCCGLFRESLENLSLEVMLAIANLKELLKLVCARDPWQ